MNHPSTECSQKRRNRVFRGSTNRLRITTHELCITNQVVNFMKGFRMTKENFTDEPTFKGSRGRRAGKWVVASVVAMSLFGTGFAIAYASSRRSFNRDTVREQGVTFAW